ncbi:LysR family transcriptional regulator [Legionella sainthelensi]|uniref:HTH lysR-type domain-containing protein n=1 Tax=Legionella sainthelensi TaxID=28087 RepID=A0A2H5FM17_9GAMM|nr:LysR family transcriptional regulator [Legionella sainthelensi]AUH72584.1 LysR family transcriptional regulator [Legionella sainthelensi]
MKFYHHVDAFLFVYELGSFTKAAEKLNISQAAVSVQIKNLESYIGKKLFERKGKSVLATYTAKNLANLISEPFSEIRGIIDSFSKYTNSMHGEIEIEYINEFALSLLIPKIFVCLEHGIKLRMNSSNKDITIIKALLENEINFGLTSIKNENPNLKYLKLFDEELIFVGSKRWVSYLDPTNTITFKESLKSLRWFAYDKELPFIRRYIEFAFDMNSNFIQPALVLADFNGLIHSIKGGHGVACLPRSYLLPYLENQSISQLYFPQIPPRYNVYLAYRASCLLNKRMKFFKEIIDTFVASTSYD